MKMSPDASTHRYDLNRLLSLPVCSLHLLLLMGLCPFLSVEAAGQSYEEVKRRFQKSFSSSSIDRQLRDLRELGKFDRKEAFDLIEKEMSKIAVRLWNIESTFRHIDRQWGKEHQWSDAQKQAIQIHKSGQLDELKEVYKTGAQQLRNPGKPEWLLSLVHRWGRKSTKIHTMYGLMKGKLLQPLKKIKTGEATRLLLDVLRQAERFRTHIKQKKSKINQELYSYSHEKNLKHDHLRRPFYKRNRITLRISVMDVLRRRIYRHLSNVTGDESIQVLVEYGLNSPSPQVRAAAAYGIGFKKDSRSKNVLVEQLKNEENYRVQIELLKAIGRRGIQSAEDVVQPFLARHRTPVQYAAAHVLGRIGTMDSMSALIDRMEEVKSGRLFHEIVYSLSFMSGKAIEPKTGEWRSWWKDNKENALNPPSKRRLPKEIREENQPNRKSSTEFYGVSLTSNNIMFVVDASLSMGNAADYTGTRAGFRPSGPGPRVPPLPEEPTKWDVAKNQLMKAIKGLEANQLFNITFFAGFVSTWSKNQMVPATPENKRKAFKFIKNAKLEWATVIYEALEYGFNFGHVGKTPIGEQKQLTSRMAQMAPDTSILLSDGAPALGQYDQREKSGAMFNNIFQKVNQLNQFRLMKISAISLGRKKFFQKLVNRSIYYPVSKKRPEWWIQPGVAVGR